MVPEYILLLSQGKVVSSNMTLTTSIRAFMSRHSSQVSNTQRGESLSTQNRQPFPVSELASCMCLFELIVLLGPSVKHG
jgi:hypothetical protein